MNTKEPKSADEHRLSESESSSNTVQVEQKSYEMPPRDGITIAHFLTVADIDRSARFYETVFGGRILSRGDNSGAPAYIQIANTWLLVYLRLAVHAQEDKRHRDQYLIVSERIRPICSGCAAMK